MYCAARHCSSVWNPSSKLRFHSFPKDPNRRTLWLSSVLLKGHFYESAKICSLHFKEKDYLSKKPGFLRKDARPSNFTHQNNCDGDKLISILDKNIDFNNETSQEPAISKEFLPEFIEVVGQNKPDKHNLQYNMEEKKSCKNDPEEIKIENCIEIDVPGHLFECLGSNKSLENFCRICLKFNETLVSLFSTRDNQMCLADLLKSFTSIKLSSEESVMPSKICVECQAILVQSYYFKVKCERAEFALQSILKGQFVPADDNKEYIEALDIPKTEESEEISNDKSESCEAEDVEYLDLNELENDESVRENIEHVNGKKMNMALNDSNTLVKEIYSENKSFSNGDVEKSRNFYSCNICYVKFNTVKNYKMHIKQKHSSDEVSYPCVDCKEEFSTQHDLQLHLGLHMKGPIWKCQECSKEFKTRTLFKRHIHRHMVSKRFKCSYCDKSFAEFYALRRHTRIHTGEIVEKKHVCNICNKKYSENSLLVAHMARHDSVRPFVCTTCGKTFISARLLNSHRKVHSDFKQYACVHCDKRFRHDSTRNTHQRTHTGEKPYVCSICGKTFIQNSNLRLHMRTHTGEKPYPCDKCEKMFTSSSALKTHMRKHTGEKPYSCTICGKRFARMSLNAHMRQHTGERPHACTVCSKRFVNATRLRDHCRIHTGEKPYECASCTNTFPTRSHFTKHMKTHHLKKKQEKKQYFVVPQTIEPGQYILTNEKLDSPLPQQDVGTDVIIEESNQNSILPAAHEEIEVTNKLVLQEDGEVLVVDNSQNQNGSIYLSTGVNDCSDVSLVTVNGGEVDISASSAMLEGSTVKLYQLDQSLLQIRRSGSQVTISKITSKMTANF